MALGCCFLRDEGSMCPLFVWAGKSQALPLPFDKRMSSVAFTRGVMGMRRRAFSVFPK